jgi:8-oxo-dGTP pyrophosphatase MutT (NUDIX family)
VLDFDPSRTPVAPKPAATVVVVRQAERGIELFCVERHARSGFLGGAIVFPGGKLDAADEDPAWGLSATSLGGRTLGFGPTADAARGLAVAALRELFEEAAILPVAGDGLDGRQALELRDELASRQQGSRNGAAAFRNLLEERRLIPDLGRLEALWRWITPAAETRRYDTCFYVLPLPVGQSGLHDRHETTSSFWALPAVVLERWERGELFLAPPTVRSIEIFAEARSIEQVLGIARAQSLEPICPVFVLDCERPVLTLPGDPLYPEPRAPPADPQAPTRFEFQGTRLVGRRAL